MTAGDTNQKKIKNRAPRKIRMFACLHVSEVEVSVVAMAVGVSLVLLVSQQKVIYIIRTFNSD